MRRRKLEELNVIDNFLFQEMVNRGEKGEKFCRILLETVLQVKIRKLKVTPQKNLQGMDTDKHGIIFDAYIEAVKEEMAEEKSELDAEVFDIEPNKYQDGSESRRSRYYHALIDARILRSGGDYSELRDVTVIMILPYDPFGKGRMQYTVEPSCQEDNTVNCRDGSRTIYLYTRGEADEACTELCDMLNFIENSTIDNAVNEDLRYMYGLMDEIKRDERVGVEYMKWEEIKLHERNEGREEGRRQGREEGRKQGCEEGQARMLITAVCKKIKKGNTVSEIADMLETDEGAVTRIYDIAVKYAPEYDVESILKEYLKGK